MDQAAAERIEHLKQLTLAMGQLVQNGHNPHHETGDGGRIAQSEMDDGGRISQLENLVATLVELAQNHNNGGENERDVMSKIVEREPDFYWGKDDPIELENWIRSFEKILTAVNCPTNRQVKIAVYYFKGEADKWWKYNKDVFLARENFDWEALKVALRARFYPHRVKLEKFKEFLALKQDGMSVTEYYNKFTELLRLVEDLLPDEAMKVYQFVTGLNFNIKRYIVSKDFATVHEAYEKVGNIVRVNEMERMHAKKRKAYGGGESSRGQSQGNDRMFRPNNSRGNHILAWRSFGNRGKRHYHCRRCQQDHPGVDCQGMAVKCHNCGEIGHRRYECQMNINSSQRMLREDLVQPRQSRSQ